MMRFLIYLALTAPLATTPATSVAVTASSVSPVSAASPVLTSAPVVLMVATAEFVAPASQSHTAHSQTQSPVHSQYNTVSLDKACLAQKKSRTLCNCVSRNVAAKMRNKDYSDEQFGMLVEVMRARKPAADQASLDYDTMADFLAGLEYHCQENPKYSVD